ncbi:MAG TPA: HIT domain-containing protein [Dehalococcoidia bacterium]|nr:HIT domain-containing protein [Dehalococcoidia bacterium]
MGIAIEWKNSDWFCSGILDGSLPAERLYESDQALAFLAPAGHRNKKYDVHALVIPKRHVETLLDIDGDGELAGALVEAIGAAVRALGLDERGFFVRANVLPPYQGTGHAHIHLLSGKRKKKMNKS